jgi:hypothetical protein
MHLSRDVGSPRDFPARPVAREAHRNADSPEVEADLIAPLREPRGPFPSSKINYGDSSSDGVIQARHMDSNRSAALKRFGAPAAISQISRQLFGLNKNVRYGGRTKEGRSSLPVSLPPAPWREMQRRGDESVTSERRHPC